MVLGAFASARGGYLHARGHGTPQPPCQQARSPVSVCAGSWATPVHLAVSHSQMAAVSADCARHAEAM